MYKGEYQGQVKLIQPHAAGSSPGTHQKFTWLLMSLICFTISRMCSPLQEKITQNPGQKAAGPISTEMSRKGNTSVAEVGNGSSACNPRLDADCPGSLGQKALQYICCKCCCQELHLLCFSPSPQPQPLPQPLLQRGLNGT